MINKMHEYEFNISKKQPIGPPIRKVCVIFLYRRKEC